MPVAFSMEEQSWLDEVRHLLAERFADTVERLVVFGSKARGDAREESDLDLLLLIRYGDWRVKDAIARELHDLAIGTDVVPSVQIYTTAEWDRLKELESVFRETVEREGVTVG